jgi:hypothetical protein
MSVRQARLRALAHERENGGSESRPKRPTFDLADVGILESSERLSGKIVVAARQHMGPLFAEKASESAWSRTAPT